VRQARAWLVLGPVVLAGVLVGHHAAYRVTGTPEGVEHDYLAHAQQVLLVLLVLGLALTALGRRTRLPSRWTIPLAALGTFAAQEHLERMVHTGSVPWLLTTPAFLVGLLFQLPLAALAWLVSRGVLEALAEPQRRRGALRTPRLLVAPLPVYSAATRPMRGAPLPGRGPPLGVPA